jgi:hypothetical protein
MGDRSSRELRELVVRLAVPKSLEGMVATTCCLKIQMGIGSLFMKRVEDRVVNKGYEGNRGWGLVQEPVAKMRFIFRLTLWPKQRNT